jgi:hypothetical protein
VIDYCFTVQNFSLIYILISLSHFSLKLNEQLVYRNGVTSGNSHGFHFAGTLRLEDILHLHGFQDAKFLAIFNFLTNLHADTKYLSRHRGHDRLGSVNLDNRCHVLLVLELVSIVDQSLHNTSLVGELILQVVSR